MSKEGEDEPPTKRRKVETNIETDAFYNALLIEYKGASQKCEGAIISFEEFVYDTLAAKPSDQIVTTAILSKIRPNLQRLSTNHFPRRPLENAVAYAWHLVEPMLDAGFNPDEGNALWGLNFVAGNNIPDALIKRLVKLSSNGHYKLVESLLGCYNFRYDMHDQHVERVMRIIAGRVVEPDSDIDFDPMVGCLQRRIDFSQKKKPIVSQDLILLFDETCQHIVRNLQPILLQISPCLPSELVLLTCSFVITTLKLCKA